MHGRDQNSPSPSAIGKPTYFVYALRSEFTKGTSVIQLLNHHEILTAQLRTTTFGQFSVLTTCTDTHFSAGFSTGGTAGCSVGGCDFLQPLNAKATTARVTSTERITFLMLLSFQKVFRTIQSSNIRPHRQLSDTNESNVGDKQPELLYLGYNQITCSQ